MREIGSLLSKRNMESPAERKFFEGLKYFELIPEIQYPVSVFYLDFAFPEKQLALEVDGRRFHAGDLQRERDQFRQKSIEAMGWKFERFPGWMVWRHSRMTAAKIALKYFSSDLTEQMKLRATGEIAKFLSWNNPELAVSLAEGM